jgi:tetratricopeptide (TPR) repeat protein
MNAALGSAGTVLRDRYQLIELAGSGGQGAVWRALDLRHDRTVAIKLRPGSRADERDLMSEARVLLNVRPHPNIPLVREDFFEDGLFCLVMDWIEGSDLTYLPNSATSFDEVLSYIDQVATALDHLHSHDPVIVHQDVKPSNIVVTRDGRAVLVDFGIARAAQRYVDPSGTTMFIAPEVIQGAPATAASDVYSFAVTIFTILTGNTPEPGIGPDLAWVPATYRERVVSALQRGLASDPDRRPATAGALALALRPPVGRRLPGLLGRTAELAELDRRVGAAREGLGSVVYIAGEPGIGKTALCAALVDRAERSGIQVYGASADVSVGAFGVWRSVLHAAGIDDRTTVATLDGTGAARTSDVEQFVVFESVIDALRGAAQKQPLAIVLEDMHAADAASVALLSYLVERLSGTPVLVLATLRQAEAAKDASLGPLLEAAAKRGDVMELSGLGSDDVATFIESAGGRPPAPGTVDAIHRATAGNPLFLVELTRLLRSSGQLERPVSGMALPIPVNVRDAIRRRLQQLDADVLTALEIGAIHGLRFDEATVAELRGAGPPVAGLLADAQDAGLVSLTDDGYAFTHALICEQLYESVPLVRRANLHAAIARAIERDARDDDAEAIAALAHHSWHGAQLGIEVDAAARYALRAARRLHAERAYKDANVWYERALQLADRADLPEDERCAAQVYLAQSLWQLGETTQAVQAARAAVPRVRALGNAEMLARVAASAGSVHMFGVRETESIALIEEALAHPDCDPRDRAHLASLLAIKYAMAGENERVAPLLDEALDVARRYGEPHTLSNVLYRRARMYGGPDHVHERLANSEESAELAIESDNTIGYRHALIEMIACLLEIGERTRIDVELHRLEEAAARSGHGLSVWHAAVFRATLLTIDGNLTAAERQAERALEIGQSIFDPDALLNFGLQLAAVRREQGRVGEIAPMFREATARYPGVPIWPLVLSYLDAESGNLERARDEWPAVVATLDTLPRDRNWLIGVTLGAETCVHLGDAGCAGMFRTMLMPYADRFSTGGTGSVAWSSIGRVAGSLAMLMGDLDEAREMFDRAQGACGRLQARLEAARVAAEVARLPAN